LTAWRPFVFLSSALLLGSVEFALLLVGWLTFGLLVITPLSVPVLIGFRVATGALAGVESSLARSLVGARTDARRHSSGGSGFWGRGMAVVVDSAFWREQGYLLLRAFVGWPLAVLVVSLLASSLYLVGLPIYYRWAHPDLGGWHPDSLQWAIALVPLGAAGVVLTALLSRWLGTGWRSAADALLREREPREHVNLGILGMRAFRVHLFATALADAIVLVVWAWTGGGSFWPGWVLVGTGLPLALHGWVRYAGMRRERRGLRLQAGISAILAIFFVLVWALAGGGYFWPGWPIGVLAVALVVHALVEYRRDPLEERIRVLETTRAGAVDVQETELRRIERDLHDGAQARLVALGMNLGMAEQKLDADPEAARDLVAEARAGVEEALRELRGLARGIHPPVLTDRGLEAAISSLAHTSAVPVFVSADVPTRPPAAVETAAYFVVAEAMANAAKHAGATRIEVRIVRLPTMLVAEVVDDGRGGADPAGSGLTGLRHRVEALDGRLTVTSPSGGGTTLRAELPCES
jgi:signal transduction histidine kinase